MEAAALTTADRLLDTLGARLYAARRHAHITPPQMAEHLGVHRNNISRWESDRGLPTLAVLRHWAEVCDVSAGWLLDGAGADTRRYLSPIEAWHGQLELPWGPPPSLTLA